MSGTSDGSGKSREVSVIDGLRADLGRPAVWKEPLVQADRRTDVGEIPAMLLLSKQPWLRLSISLSFYPSI